jgi:hypothetical protein
MAHLRTDLSQYMDRLLSELAILINRPQKDALEHLLLTIEILARNGKLDIGLEWTEAMEKTNRKGLGASTASRTGDLPHIVDEAIDFDVSLLETSAKCKGGYAGVYLVNGSKFRAIVPNPKGGTCFLASRPQALDAAIDRYRWHEEHGLPYGNIGRHVDDLKKRHPDWTVEQCLKSAQRFAEDTVLRDMKWPFTSVEASTTIARFRKAQGLPDLPDLSALDDDDDQSPEVKARAAEALRKSRELFDDDDGSS